MRNIPAALAAHLAGTATTTTRLLKIKTTSSPPVVFGLCMSDQNIAYDDASGDGEVNYVAMDGFDASTFSADTGYAVSNAEGYALISGEVEGVEIEDINAGILDDAEWVCYLVNFNDLTMGHVILDAGDVGEVKTRFGLVWMPELLSYIMRLKQPIGGVWSRTCRAIFGTPSDSQTGCGVDLGPLWRSGTVLSVGTETNRVFSSNIDSPSSPSVPFFPGRVQFLTGDNAGREFATEMIDGEEISLNETTNFPIQVGDTYRIRPDCRKRYLEDCIQTWNNGPNFKGEPYIPVGDAMSGQVPGAQHGSSVPFEGRALSD